MKQLCYSLDTYTYTFSIMIFEIKVHYNKFVLRICRILNEPFPIRKIAIYPVSTNLHVATRSHNITTAYSLPEFGHVYVYVYFLLLQNYEYTFQQGLDPAFAIVTLTVSNNIYKLYIFPAQEY